MSDPDDKTLLEFVARFAGWTELTSEAGRIYGVPPSHYKGHCFTELPDYLHSVDAFIMDVWPKMTLNLGAKWIREMSHTHGIAGAANADARSRCLALYRALEGKLP